MENNPYSPPTSNVATAEVAASGELASLLNRFGAAVIDGLILGGLVMPIYYFMGVFAQQGNVGFGMLLLMAAIGFGIYVLVNGWLLARSGQTVGKRLLKIRIVSLDGQSVPLQKILLVRQLPIHLLTLVPFLGNLVGIVDSLFVFRADRRCIHDLIAGTKVINC
jgi:uncharacterized RDD family membrane protein YckC